MSIRYSPCVIWNQIRCNAAYLLSIVYETTGVAKISPVKLCNIVVHPFPFSDIVDPRSAQPDVFCFQRFPKVEVLPCNKYRKYQPKKGEKLKSFTSMIEICPIEFRLRRTVVLHYCRCKYCLPNKNLPSGQQKLFCSICFQLKTNQVFRKLNKIQKIRKTVWWSFN